MNVDVRYLLPATRPVVDADSCCVSLHGVPDGGEYLVEGGEERLRLLGGQVLDAGDVRLRDQHRVAWGYRAYVEEGEAVLVLVDASALGCVLRIWSR